MRIRSLLVLSTIGLLALSACVENTATNTETAMTERPKQTMVGGLPQPYYIVGEAGAGNKVAALLRSDGIKVYTDLKGRAAGLKAFCSGTADSFAISKDLSDAERRTCKSLGGDWSALSVSKVGAALYTQYKFANALLNKGKKTFAIK